MRILVTGGSGLLGATLIYLGRTEHTVMGCSLRTRLRADRFQATQFDLRDGASFRKVTDHFKPDWICHTAALTDVDLCEKSPTLAQQQNVDVSVIVAQEAVRLGARLLHISTDAVFDGTSSFSKESDATGPVNHYALTKLKGEEAVLATLPAALVVRTNFYGWNAQPKQSLAEWMLAQMRAGVPIPAWEDVTFTPLFAGDLARILLRMMELEVQGLFNVAGAERLSKFAFGLAVAKTWNLDTDLVVPTRIGGLDANRPQDTSLCTAKLVAEIGEAPPPLAQGLENMRIWEHTHLGKLRLLIHG